MASIAIPAVIAGISALAPLLQRKEKQRQISSLTPEQSGVQNQLLKLLQGQLGGGGLFGQSQNFLSNILGGDTSKFEAPLMRQFQEQIIPQLAERFAGLGAGSSSGFQQALGGAGAGLLERLGSLRGMLGLQASGMGLQSLQNLLQPALQSSFTTGIRPSNPGPLAELIGPIAQGFGGGFGQLAGQNLASSVFSSSPSSSVNNDIWENLASIARS